MCVFCVQVLEVHEQLERPAPPFPTARGAAGPQPGEGDMDEAEKAIVREMCNVSLSHMHKLVPCGLCYLKVYALLLFKALFRLHGSCDKVNEMVDTSEIRSVPPFVGSAMY